MATKLDDHFNVKITKQSLHERFNENAVQFLSKAFEKLLQKQSTKSKMTLIESAFNRVVIKDSICFQINEALANDYPGSGGVSSKAAVRIQFEFDLLSGTITDISLNAFNDQDAKNSLATIEQTQAGDLVLRDLAYMSIPVLKAIIHKVAYFLCRPKAQVKIYKFKKGKYTELNFVNIVKHMKKMKISFLEEEIYYGKKDKLKFRLIMHLMPDAEVEKRLRKAKKTAKRKGQTLSKEYKSRVVLNLFITNASPEQIPTENVWPIYRLRWQVEFMFKVWKSIFKIDKVKNVNKERLECYIYSKLILILLGWNMIWFVAKKMYTILGEAISFNKAFKALMNIKLNKFYTALKLSSDYLAGFVVDFYEISIRHHLLEKRLKEQKSIEIIDSCLSK